MAPTSVVDPNTLCKRCYKVPTNRVVKCIKCSSVYHVSCAQYKGAELIEEGKVNCCSAVGDGDLPPGESGQEFPWSAMSDKAADGFMDVRLFNYIIKQKDDLIGELHEKIKLLNDFIQLLKNSSTTPQSTLSDKPNNKKSKKKADVKNAPVEFVNKELQQHGINSRADQRDNVDNTVDERESINCQKGYDTKEMRQVVSQPKQSAAPQNRQPTSERSVSARSKKGVIYGKAKKPDSDKCIKDPSVPTELQISFAGVARRAWLYVGRADRSTTVEGVKRFLVEKCGTADIIVEKLTNSDESYSLSFKVGVDFDLLDTLLDGEFWPAGLQIRRFRFFRGKRQLSQEISK